MAINFNGQTTIINSQIGNNNTAYYNDSLTEDDWKNIEHFFTKSIKEIDNDCELYDFFNESKKYASDKNAVELKHHFKKNCTEFIKSVIYNMASTGIISLLSQIGVTL